MSEVSKRDIDDVRYDLEHKIDSQAATIVQLERRITSMRGDISNLWEAIGNLQNRGNE